MKLRSFYARCLCIRAGLGVLVYVCSDERAKNVSLKFKLERIY